jgi:hypothetical protein
MTYQEEQEMWAQFYEDKATHAVSAIPPLILKLAFTTLRGL